jgi:hypothetical protein
MGNWITVADAETNHDGCIENWMSCIPHDIESAAERSSPVLRRGCGAAFSVPDGDHELVVVVCEVNRQEHDMDAVR